MTNQPSGTDPKIVAILAYITLIGWLAAVIMNSNDRSSLGSFHVRQALGIYLLVAASSMVMIVPILGWIAGILGYLLALVLWFIGLIAALNEEEKIVPVLGEQFQEWFRSL
jgi:uncharacterized membrane protein